MLSISQAITKGKFISNVEPDCGGIALLDYTAKTGKLLFLLRVPPLGVVITMAITVEG